MDQPKEFCIPFSSLKLGSNVFDYKINNKFFKSYDYPVQINCNITVEIDLVKEIHLFDLKIKYFGITSTICDRCLSDIDVEIKSEFNTVVKFDHIKDINYEHDVIYIPYESYELNIAPVLYEHYLLNTPERNVHSEKNCDQKQLSIVQKYTDPLHEYKINPDPRWDTLKDLKNKK